MLDQPQLLPDLLMGLKNVYLCRRFQQQHLFIAALALNCLGSIAGGK